MHTKEASLEWFNKDKMLKKRKKIVVKLYLGETVLKSEKQLKICGIL